jgi:hypothetical protein
VKIWIRVDKEMRDEDVLMYFATMDEPYFYRTRLEAARDCHQLDRIAELDVRLSPTEAA